MRKLVVFIISIVALFLMFLLFYYHVSDYSTIYMINAIEIEEKYFKDKEYYQFILTYNDIKFSIISLDKYSTKRKLITDIAIKEDNSKICLIPESEIISTYPICYDGNELISYQYTDEVKKDKIDTFSKIDIYDYDNKTFLLWNYKNFLYLNKNNHEEINLFTKDVYNLNLVMTYKNYLVVPDYDNNYTFNKIYMIDVDKLKVNNISLRYDIYFDSNFLGYQDKMIYLYDKKQEQEYYINTKKGRIYRTSNKLLLNGKWEKTSTYQLKEENKVFYNDLVYNYEVINSKLYGYIENKDFLTKITDLDVKQIVKKDNLSVYFISGNTLYKYHPNEGVKALLSYSEWDFNYNNMIFIF